MTLTSRRKYERWRRKRRAVSPVIAELLLIVITVALGTLVYSFASTAFGGFGSGFSNLVQSAGAQLSEKIVVEQAYFYNTVTNNTNCEPGPAIDHCGGVLYVRNVGASPVQLVDIFLGNVTSPSSEPISTVPDSAPYLSCSSSALLPAKVATAQPGQVCFYTFVEVPNPCTGAPPGALYCNNLLPPPQANAVANEIQPGAVAIVHFMLPISSYCVPASGLNCTVAFGGTTYAFTLVTARGNNFVAYETA
jgi:flagellin-like protein